MVYYINIIYPILGAGGSSHRSSDSEDSRSTDSNHTRSSEDDIAGVKEEIHSTISPPPASVQKDTSNNPGLHRPADRGEPSEGVRHQPSQGVSSHYSAFQPLPGSSASTNFRDTRQEQWQQGEWQDQRQPYPAPQQQDIRPDIRQQEFYRQHEHPGRQGYHREQEYQQQSQDNLNRFFQSWNMEGNMGEHRSRYQETEVQGFRQPPEYQEYYPEGRERQWGQDYGAPWGMPDRKRRRSPEPGRYNNMEALVDRMPQGPSQHQVHEISSR